MQTSTAEMLEAVLDIVAFCIKNMKFEGMALARVIKLNWSQVAEPFLYQIEEAVDFEKGTVNPVAVSGVISDFEDRFSKDFVESVLDAHDNYIESSYNLGLEMAAFHRTAKAYDVLEELISVTGARKDNVKRALRGWFSQTQGQYFDRFIKRETDLLRERFALADTPGKLKEIGNRYKRFVKADGYWDSISDFNTGTASSWAQLDGVQELGYTTYTVHAIHDEVTCSVCLALDGKEYSVADGQKQISNMLGMGAEDAAKAFPWPRKGTVGETSFPLPPYHSRCRCWVEGTKVSGTAVLPQEIDEFKVKYPQLSGINDASMRDYLSDCLYVKELNIACLDRLAGNLADQVLGDQAEYALNDILGLTGKTSHKHPVDLLVPPGHIGKRGLAIEVKAKRAELLPERKKIRMGTNALKRKKEFCKINDCDPHTIATVIDRNGVMDIYWKKGHGGYRIHSMEWIGQAKRENWRDTIFDPEVREKLFEVLGGV